MLKSYRLFFAVLLGCMLVSMPALAQGTPEAAVADAVANSGDFPAGTTVVSTTIDGASAVVELSVEAAPMGLGDAQADDMVKAITNALGDFPEITAIEVTVAGKPLWEYLPRPGGAEASGGSVTSLSIGASSPGAGIGILSIGGGGGEGSGVPALTGELAGKGVGLYNSHGAYFDQRPQYYFWRWTQRTLCGPNMAPPRPPGWSGSVYQPSNYYYNTRGFQWGSYYEDWRTDMEIRFLRAYLESSGATVLCGRNLDKNAGLFDYNAYGYPNCSFPLYKWITAAKYHLQEIGAPASVWNEPSLSAETDKDIRARPYWTNYHMVEPIFGVKKWPLTSAEIQTVRYRPDIWENWVSIHLHTNAAGSGQGKGTETYWYTSTYPWLQAKATSLATIFNTAVVNAVRTEYDGYWAEATAMYGYTGANPPEWPTGVGSWTGYAQTSPTSKQWANRGPKTTNFGEIREAMVPAVLMEMLFHDDWKFYPDHVFSMDQIFSATAAWGMYEGICNYFGIAPKPRMAATVLQPVSFPTLVGPNAAISGSVTMQNEGQVWCWGDKWVSMVYQPYTVWKLAPTANNQLGGGEIAIANVAPIYPGESATFGISLTGPAATGLYTTEWQMENDGAFGGAFGGVASAQIQVDADPPVITISSPSGDVPYGCQTVDFDVTDAIAGVASVSADIDGAAVSDGQSVCGLGLGSHTLTVSATDNVGNSATASSTFNVVNTAGKTTAGGWIELADKKGTCGFVSEYVAGDPAPQGNVTYQDHDTGMTVHSVELVAMGIIGNQAWIFGACTIEGEAGHTFRIDVVDNGEPGSTDEFHITLDTGYYVGGTLGGGNVTIH